MYNSCDVFSINRFPAVPQRLQYSVATLGQYDLFARADSYESQAATSSGDRGSYCKEFCLSITVDCKCRMLVLVLEHKLKKKRLQHSNNG
jgi:hypothetical protein